MPFLHNPKKREPWYKWAEEKARRTGLRHKVFYPEGGYYKGEWKRGFQTGKGVQILPSGEQYEGDWLCNQKHGFGILSRYSEVDKRFYLVYSGEFKNDKIHGYGSMYFRNGDFYEGEFKFGQRHGFGRCWYANCSYYEGYWVKDNRHGYGMYVQANGNRYEGEWLKDRKNGWGIFLHLDSGQRQVGVWENDNCVSSLMEDIKYRQSAINPTEYPIIKSELDPNVPCVNNLSKAEKMYLIYNEGCNLHKFCYKASSKRGDGDESK